ncbi:MAG: antitoxin VapB family protein [Promethearchaeota archaeon]
MVSKTITITDEVYQLLKSLKRENESFSELLKRLAMQVNGQKLEKFFGAWDIDDKEYADIQEKIKRSIIQFNKNKAKID